MKNYIEEKLKNLGANFKKLNKDEIISISAETANNKTIGWFQGRMEFGPRALGCRSILADQDQIKCKKN